MPPVPTQILLPFTIFPQNVNWEPDVSSSNVSFVHHLSKATTFSCIHPMCTKGGWAMLSINDNHLAMDTFKGTPLHQTISALEQASTTAISRATPENGSSINSTLDTTSGWFPLRSTRPQTINSTSAILQDWQNGSHSPCCIPPQHDATISSIPVTGHDEVCCTTSTPNTGTDGISHLQPCSLTDRQMHMMPAPMDNKRPNLLAPPEGNSRNNEGSPAPLAPDTANERSNASNCSQSCISSSASHASIISVPSSIESSNSPMTQHLSEAATKRRVRFSPNTRLDNPPLGLVDPLAGYAKKARLDPSISPTAAWVQQHLDHLASHQLLCLWPPSQEHLLRSIREALAWSPKPRSVPIFQFELNNNAAAHNFDVPLSHNFDLDKILLSDPFSTIRPGSEFCPVGLLEPIIGNHILWPCVCNTMLHGAQYHLLPLDDDLRHQDLIAAIKFGNHKSAQKHSAATLATLTKEVTKGWQLPLPIDRLLDIPHLVMTPVGMAEQLKLNASGERTPDRCLTHNMSMVFEPSGMSLNGRVDSSKLSKCVYGFALVRFVNAIVKLHRRHHNCIIYLSKFDLKSAYCQVHLHGQSALQTCISTQGLQASDKTVLALLGLRMTFGGKPNSAIFCKISDCIVNLAIAISQCPDWSPVNLPSSYSHILQTPIQLPINIPFAQARPALVQPSIPEAGTADGFIEDIFSANVVTDKNLHADRLAQAVLLAIEVLGRPHSKFEPLMQDLLLSLEKAEAEGTPNEVLIVLGWLLDTRHLRISLPHDKFIAWTNDVKAIINPPPTDHGFISGKVLESIKGCF